MILRIASSRIVGQGDIVGRSGYFSLNLSANSVMRGRLDARRTLKSLVADLRILKNLFEIMEAFKDDLYPEKGAESKERYSTQRNNPQAQKDESKWNEIVDNFITAIDPDRGDEAINTENESIRTNMSTNVKAACPQWESKKEEWGNRECDGKRWKVEDDLGTIDGFKIVFPDTGTNSFIDVGWYNGHYYIQGAYWCDPNFAKALKAKYKGYRSYGNWWKYLEGEYYDIPQGEFVNSFCNNENLRKYIFEWIERLMDIIEREHTTMKLLKAVGQREGWNLWTWEWDTLTCDYKDSQLGTPFIDAKKDIPNNKFEISFWCRTEDRDLTKKLYENMDCDPQLKQEEDGFYLLEQIPADTSMEVLKDKVNGWMDKVENAAKKYKSSQVVS